MNRFHGNQLARGLRFIRVGLVFHSMLVSKICVIQLLHPVAPVLEVPSVFGTLGHIFPRIRETNSTSASDFEGN